MAILLPVTLKGLPSAESVVEELVEIEEEELVYDDELRVGFMVKNAWNVKRMKKV